MTTTETLTAEVRNGIDFKVADLSLADYGRRDIELSEHEMPGYGASTRTCNRSRARESPARCT